MAPTSGAYAQDACRTEAVRRFPQHHTERAGLIAEDADRAKEMFLRFVLEQLPWPDQTKIQWMTNRTKWNFIKGVP